MRHYVYIMGGLLFILVLVAGNGSGKTWIVDDDWAGADFNTLAEAYNGTSEFDTIRIFNGTYIERVRISKPLTIIGNGSNTIIDGDNIGDVIRIISDNVHISSLTIRNSGEIHSNKIKYCGIELFNSSHCSFYKLNIANNDDAVIARNCYNLTFEDNLVSNNDGGLDFYYVNNSRIDGNIIFENKGRGLMFYSSENTFILNNTCEYNDVDGISVIYDSFNSSVINNSCRYNGYNGIWTTGNVAGLLVLDNELVGNVRSGFCMDNTNNVQISNNSISRNHIYGIDFNPDRSGHFYNISITHNTIDNNSRYGVRFSPNKHFSRNYSFSQNLVYDNDFIWNNGNETQALDNCGGTSWYQIGEGNYWSDYSGTDLDIDGTGDQPMTISGTSGSEDIYPMMRDIELPSPTVWVVDDDVGNWSNYTSIQDAINNSNPYDSIYVFNGTYNSFVNITKRIKLIGNGSANTTIIGNGKTDDEDPLLISANRVTVHGFTILSSTDRGSGCEINRRDHVTLSDCIIKDHTGVGIYHQGNFLTIQNSTMNGNYNGLRFSGSNLTVRNCTFKNNDEFSIFGRDPRRENEFYHVIIDNCTFKNNPDGIRLEEYSGYTITSCIIEKSYGIKIEGRNPYNLTNEIRDTIVNDSAAHGIYLHNGDYLTIRNCTIENSNYDGLYLWGTNHAMILNSSISNSGSSGIDISAHDILIDNCTIIGNSAEGLDIFGNRITITYNNISNNDGYGIDFRNHENQTGDNVVTQNMFIDNKVSRSQCNDDSNENTWYSGSGGNYWSDYNGTDHNNDGIGDTSYPIDGGGNSKDIYPLMQPGNTRDQKPPSISISAPLNGTVVSDVLTLAGSASDNRIVVSVNIKIANDTWNIANGTDLWTISLPITDFPNGNTTVSLRSYDGNHFSNTKVIYIFIKNNSTDDEDPRSESDDGSIIRPLSPSEKVGIGAIISLSVISLIALTETGKFLLIGAFASMYARMKDRSKDEVLDNFVRGQIYGYVKTNPGVHYTKILKELEVTNGTLSHHLYTLEKMELIKSRREGLRFRAFYPTGMKFPKDEKFRLSELQIDILKTIESHPGIFQKEIAKILEKRQQTVNYNIKMLERIGKVRLEKEGQFRRCYTNRSD